VDNLGQCIRLFYSAL